MGTTNRSVTKVKEKAVDTKKIKRAVEKDIKKPKDKRRKAFRPKFLNYKADLYGNPYYSPKRKKKK